MAFAIIDGDDVGNRIESRILANDVTGFVRTSKMIADAVDRLAEMSSTVPGVDVVSAGGDSILLQVAESSIDPLSVVLKELQDPESFTFSVGIGQTLRESFIALRMAKSSGKCKISAYSE
ncbi:mCpol domain-containing protein [Streptomyces griseorubiginosus]|uniref:mCpol domain-containing protein n=1 Tax=Streptomyces griseorubiginosus TaxID=67304 RepID=UPI0033EF9A6D